MQYPDSDCSEDEVNSKASKRTIVAPSKASSKKASSKLRAYMDAQATKDSSDEDDDANVSPTNQEEDGMSHTTDGGASSSLNRRGPRGTSVGIDHSKLKKIAKRAAVRLCRKEVHGYVHGMLKNFISTIVNEGCVLASDSRRKTLCINDVLYSLKRNGWAIYD